MHTPLFSLGSFITAIAIQDSEVIMIDASCGSTLTRTSTIHKLPIQPVERVEYTRVMAQEWLIGAKRVLNTKDIASGTA